MKKHELQEKVEELKDQVNQCESAIKKVTKERDTFATELKSKELEIQRIVFEKGNTKVFLMNLAFDSIMSQFNYLQSTPHNKDGCKDVIHSLQNTLEDLSSREQKIKTRCPFLSNFQLK